MKPTPAAAALEVRGLTVGYGPKIVVDDVCLAVEPREIMALVGPSGCGKTTLLRALAGFATPRSGEVLVGGETVAGGRWVPPEHRRIGMVFQQGALFPHMTVRQNVAYGVSRGAKAERRVDQALATVGLAGLAGRYPDELSGGQQQLVALARAIAPSPRAVLLDEPFANLDADLRGRLRQDVRRILEAAGMTAILVTHDQEEALSIAATVAVMIDGRVLQVASPEQVYQRPATAGVARFIGGGQLVGCSVRGGHVHSVLGTLRTAAPAGRGQLLVRPEDLALAADDHGVAGTVVERCFYGHDRLTAVRLADGPTLHVRTLGQASPPDGAAVRVALQPKAYVYYADASGASFLAQADAPFGRARASRAGG